MLINFIPYMIFYIIQILPTFSIHSTPLGNLNNAQTLVVHGGGCKSISKFTHIHLLYSSSILPHPRGYLETCWIAHVCITQFLCSVFHTLFIHANIWIFCALLENLNCMHFNHYRVGKEFTQSHQNIKLILKISSSFYRWNQLQFFIMKTVY